MDKETEAAPTISTPQDTKPATASSDKKSFGRDVGKLVSGTVVAQAVGICLTPVITRIFGPEIYGVASVFTSIVSIIVVIACMRYELAILLPDDDKDAGAILLLCLIILTAISLICIPIVMIFGSTIASIFGNEGVIDYLLLIPIAVFVDGLYIAIRYWNTRRKRFGTQALTQALQSISASGLKVGFGFTGFVIPGSLIVSQIIGQGIGAFILFVQAVRSDFKIIKESFSICNILTLAKRYKKFPLVDTWGQWINTISWQLPVLMLTGFFSSAIAGLYTLGFQILQMPLSLIGGSIGQVFYQRAAVSKQDGTLHILTNDITSLLFLITVYPCLLIFVVGGDLFAIVFGEEWRGAGVFAQILSLWVMFWFVASVTSPLVNVLEIQELSFVTSTLHLITRFIALLIGGVLGNVYIALVLFSVFGLLINVGGSVIMFKKANASLRVVWSNIHKYIIFGILSCVFLLLLQKVFGVAGLLLCGIAVILGLIYVGIVIKKNRLVKSYILP